MLCAKCGKEKGIKEHGDMLLCEHCYNIKQTVNNIILLAWKSIDCYNDRPKIEKIIEDIYNKGFNDGYWQSIYDDYGI